MTAVRAAEGKLADLCAVAFDSPEMTPCYDPVSQLVYSAGRENVTHVWVGGTLRLDRKSLSSPCFSHLDKTIQLWQNKLAR